MSDSVIPILTRDSQDKAAEVERAIMSATSAMEGVSHKLGESLSEEERQRRIEDRRRREEQRQQQRKEPAQSKPKGEGFSLPPKVAQQMEKTGQGLTEVMLGPMNLLLKPMEEAFGFSLSGSLIGGLKKMGGGIASGVSSVGSSFRKGKRESKQEELGAYGSELEYDGALREKDILKVDPGAAYLGSILADDTEGKEGILGGLFDGNIGRMAATLFPALAKALPFAALAGGILWGIIDGLATMDMADEWGVSNISAFLGGFLSGTDSGWSGAISGAGKFSLIGAGIGAMFGPMGILAGALLGGAIGGVLGYFEAEDVAQFVDGALDTIMTNPLASTFAGAAAGGAIGAMFGPLGFVAGSLIGAFVGSFLPYLQDEEGNLDIAGIWSRMRDEPAALGLAGASAGAIIGMAFGPVGMLVGALLGGAFGAALGFINKSQSNAEKEQEEIMDEFSGAGYEAEDLMQLQQDRIEGNLSEEDVAILNKHGISSMLLPHHITNNPDIARDMVAAAQEIGWEGELFNERQDTREEARRLEETGKRVNDGIIYKDGQIVHTHEDDNIFATKNDLAIMEDMDYVSNTMAGAGQGDSSLHELIEELIAVVQDKETPRVESNVVNMSSRFSQRDIKSALGVV